MTSKAFIVGAQRSGTTLMRVMLAAHPDIETYGDRVSEDALRSGNFPTSDQKVQVFKVPFLTDWLNTLSYQSEPLVFMKRDPRAVVASLLRQENTEQWLEPALTNQTWNTAWEQRYRRAIELAGSSKGGRYALYVASKQNIFKTYQTQGIPMIEVVYEDFVADAEPKLRDVVKFLGLPWRKSVLDWAKQDFEAIQGEGMFYDTFDPARPVDTTSIDKYREQLTDTEVNLIDAVVQAVVQA